MTLRFGLACIYQCEYLFILSIRIVARLPCTPQSNRIEPPHLRTSQTSWNSPLNKQLHIRAANYSVKTIPSTERNTELFPCYTLFKVDMLGNYARRKTRIKRCVEQTKLTQSKYYFTCASTSLSKIRWETAIWCKISFWLYRRAVVCLNRMFWKHVFSPLYFLAT